MSLRLIGLHAGVKFECFRESGRARRTSCALVLASYDGGTELRRCFNTGDLAGAARPQAALPPRFVVYGIGAYAMNLELSLNIAASIEGWFSDNWS